MEDKIATDSNREEAGEWPPVYEPPLLEELGSVWEETGGAGPGSVDGMSMMGVS